MIANSNASLLSRILRLAWNGTVRYGAERYASHSTPGSGTRMVCLVKRRDGCVSAVPPAPIAEPEVAALKSRRPAPNRRHARLRLSFMSCLPALLYHPLCVSASTRTRDISLSLHERQASAVSTCSIIYKHQLLEPTDSHARKMMREAPRVWKAFVQ